MNLKQQTEHKSQLVNAEEAIIIEETITDANGSDENSSPSFKEALMKVIGGEGISDGCWADLLKDDLPENRWYQDAHDGNPIATKQPNPSCPIVYATKEELADWAKPWKNTLFVKLMGKRVNYRLIERKLRAEWVKNGTMSITDMADDFYMVKLSDMEDYRHALFEGPWKIADHYLIVQRWRPLFSLTATMAQKVAVWVRIPKLPVELCNEKFLSRVGATLGTMLKMDRTTSLYSRGKFARICVELDLDKPLVSHFSFCGMKLVLEYEGLHSICFRCGKYGHKKDSCRELLEFAEHSTTNLEGQSVSVNAEQVVLNSTKANEQSDVSHHMDIHTDKTPVNVIESSDMHTKQMNQESNEQNDLNIGPWNIPKHVARKRKANSAKSVKKVSEEVTPSVLTKKVEMKVPSEHVEGSKSSIEMPLPPIIVMQDAVESYLYPQIIKPANIIKRKVKNPLGGKNPQLSVKGRPLAKNGKTPNRIEKVNIKGKAANGFSKPSVEATKSTVSGKENIASTSDQSESMVKKKAEEEAVLNFMRTMYQTQGVNLLNQFKNMEPIRLDLGQIDNNEKKIDVDMNNVSGPEIIVPIQDGFSGHTSSITDGKKQSRNGVIAPMEGLEGVVPHTPNISL